LVGLLPISQNSSQLIAVFCPAAFLFWKSKGLQGLAAASRRALQSAGCRRAALMRFIAYRDT
jgi:hypothetical protein